MNPDTAFSCIMGQGISMASGDCSGCSLPSSSSYTSSSASLHSAQTALLLFLYHLSISYLLIIVAVGRSLSCVSHTQLTLCACRLGYLGYLLPCLHYTTVSKGLSRDSHAQLHHVAAGRGTSGVLYPSRPSSARQAQKTNSTFSKAVARKPSEKHLPEFRAGGEVENASR